MKDIRLEKTREKIEYSYRSLEIAKIVFAEKIDYLEKKLMK